ncbi:MAG: T9SS type A sorting domain-containing protein, partial [Bacteroidota bacterium]
YCYNENKDSILISAGEGVEYLWSNGKRTQSFYITGGNWYYVTVTDEYGCSNDGAIQIHYNECVANVGMPGDSVITENDSIVIESNQCRYDYEQFDYTWSTGDTTYLVTLYGSDLGIGTHEIVVTVTNYGANGCTSSDTVHVTVDKASGFENRVLDAISVFPNPTNGRTTIQGERITSVEVYNVLGNLLYKDNNRGTYAINLDNEPNGIYLVKIYEGERVITRKIILQH